MSRTKGAKSVRPNYTAVAAMQKKALKLQGELEKFIDRANRGTHYSFKCLVDFNKLGEVSDHLKDVGTIKIDL